MTQQGMAADTIEAGQAWRLRVPDGSDRDAGSTSNAHVLVGAIVEFAENRIVVCCAARAPDDTGALALVPFLPLSLDAFHQTVGARDGRADLPDAFFDAFDAWMADETGKRVFDVPFEGSLDRIIARQMAKIANVEI